MNDTQNDNLSGSNRKLLLTALGALNLLAIVSLILVIVAMGNQSQISDAYEDRQNAHQLSDELRQSSDDLTRMARLYSVTGDKRYRDYFQQILDIRHGEATRPDRYSDIYWDYVTATHEYPTDRDGTEAVALRDMMEQAGFTAEELVLLEQAEDTSDALAEIETAAMQEQPEALQAGYDAQSDAVRELHGAEYNSIKGDIMQPIDEMQISLTDRMTSKIQSKTDRQDIIFPLLLALLSLAILLSEIALIRVALTTRRNKQ